MYGERAFKGNLYLTIKYACMYVACMHVCMLSIAFVTVLSVLGQFFVRKITNTRTELDVSEVAANSYTDSTSQIYHICWNALIQIWDSLIGVGEDAYRKCTIKVMWNWSHPYHYC